MVHVACLQDALSHAEMLRLFRSADVYVSPFRSEGFGLGTLEAMTMGLQACSDPVLHKSGICALFISPGLCADKGVIAVSRCA